eukprot:TRINITY_DN12238_c0_g1_i1.p2 TRINITY_DN12238_c0_g1~~TRINITY_DN12238_c0_g1_i1.p2  ORF type:complete len:262 (+),score=80.52 TRINITY_DN12238_c0_g1_i1:119-904(+)
MTTIHDDEAIARALQEEEERIAARGGGGGRMPSAAATPPQAQGAPAAAASPPPVPPPASAAGVINPLGSFNQDRDDGSLARQLQAEEEARAGYRAGSAPAPEAPAVQRQGSSQPSANPFAQLNVESGREDEAIARQLQEEEQKEAYKRHLRTVERLEHVPQGPVANDDELLARKLQESEIAKRKSGSSRAAPAPARPAAPAAPAAPVDDAQLALQLQQLELTQANQQLAALQHQQARARQPAPRQHAPQNGEKKDDGCVLM